MPVEPPGEAPRKSHGIAAAWAWTSGANLLLGLAAFIAAPIAAQALGPERRGRLVAVQLVPQLLADLSALGLGFAIIHYGARRNSSIRTLLRWSVVPLVLGSCVMFGLGQMLAAPLAGDVASDERLFRLYLVICPITAFMSIALETLRALGEFRVWNGFVLARGLSWPVSLIAGVTLFTDQLRAIVLLHLTFSVVVMVVAGIVASARTRGRLDEPDVDRRRYVGYGLSSAVSTIPRSANAKLDQVVMTGLIGRANLGLYAAAVGWSALTIPIMRGLTSITMPHISEATGDARRERSAQVVTSGVIAAAILTVGGLAATLVLWGPLYGDEYESALAAAMVLIPAALLLELNAVLGNILRSLDRPLVVAVLEAVIVVLSIAALVVVLQFDELLGPALVSLGTYAVAAACYAGLIASTLGTPVRDLYRPEMARGLRRRVMRRP